MNLKKLGLLSVCILFLLAVSSCNSSEQKSSVDFAKSMGSGWNLGNSFDSYSLEYDKGEETWGNPKVTAALFKELKERGFKSIRLPFTVMNRTNEQGIVDPAFLDAYKKAVDLSLNQGFVVIVNLHHDSKEWLMTYNGDDSSQEAKRFASIWDQLAKTFQTYSDKVVFESINEPSFVSGDEMAQTTTLFKLNKLFYQTIRTSGGKNKTRMLMLPTVLGKSDQEKLTFLANEIKGYKDNNVLATIHYYGEWPFSNNLGYVTMDETLGNPVPMTQRQATSDLVERLKKTFVDQGIGVVVGEYGLLGYDRNHSVNNLGETMKFINQFHDLTRDLPIALMLWDNGQHFNRTSLTWNERLFGEIVEQSSKVNSAYGKNIDRTYVQNVEDQVSVLLELNGRKIAKVSYNNHDLSQPQEYQFQDNQLNVSLSILNAKHYHQATGIDGTTIGTLVVEFDKGAPWSQSIIRLSGEPILSLANGVVGSDLTIVFQGNGHQLRRARLVNQQNQSITQNIGWPYLTFNEEIIEDQEHHLLQLPSLVTKKMTEGTYHLIFEWLDGSNTDCSIQVVAGKIRKLSEPVQP